MAGCRRYLAVLAAVLALQVAAIGANLGALNAWPSPAVWFGLLVVATGATAVAAVRPERPTFGVAMVTTLTVYSLRIVELVYALLWGRLAGLPDVVRATGWVALSRDATSIVALWAVWAAVMRSCAERGARVPIPRHPARAGR